MGTTGFSLFFLLPIGFFRYPFLTQSQTSGFAGFAFNCTFLGLINRFSMVFHETSGVGSDACLGKGRQCHPKEIYVNYDDNSRLDSHGFAPFAEVRRCFLLFCRSF